MKLSRCLATLSLLVLLPLAPGCSKSDGGGGSGDTSSSGSVPSFDLAQVQNAFASATGSIRAEFDRIVAAIKSQDYSGALNQLQLLASNASLSVEQKSAVNGLIEQVKAKAASLLQDATKAAGNAVDQVKEAAAKATTDASKAATDAAEAAKKSAGNLLPK